MKPTPILLLLSSIFLFSCEKEEQMMERRAELLVVHAASSIGQIGIRLSGEDVLNAQLSYGESSSIFSMPYISTGSGVRGISVSEGNTMVLENFSSFLPEGSRSTLFIYDTLSPEGNQPYFLTLDDNLGPMSDTSRVRFLNLVKGLDSVTARLIAPSDTLIIGQNQSIPLFNHNRETLSAFNLIWQSGTPVPGTMNLLLELVNNRQEVLYSDSVAVRPGMAETWYISGTYDSSAVQPFSLNYIQHR